MTMTIEKHISSEKANNDASAFGYHNNEYEQYPSRANNTVTAIHTTVDDPVASRSVPGSRRNSNDERRLFENAFHAPIDFLTKPPPRSFSIDVGSMHGEFNNQMNYTSFFNGSNNSNTDVPTTTTSYSQSSYLGSRYYNHNNEINNSSRMNSNSNYGLFSSESVSDLELDFNLKKHSVRSVESLRSKSWAQYLDTNAPLPPQQQTQFYSTNSNPSNAANAQNVQAAFYGQPVRRFSHSWLPTTTATTTTAMNSSLMNHSASNSNIHTNSNSSRLTTSYSYSDIQMTAALGSYRMHNGNNQEFCQNFRQHGYCNLKEQCPYPHISTTLLQQHHSIVHEPPTPALRYSNSTSTCNSNNFADPSSSSFLYEQLISPLHNLKQEVRRTSTTSGLSIESELNKFAGVQLEEFQGRLYELCTDQHGCRYLQLKMEEAATNVTIIYEEIHAHFVELMTDPFGNYLCQKLLERCDDEQRSRIVEVITPDFLKICLSMHGTRAVQKLIEFLSTKRQIQAVIAALQPNVVALIKDLNGNHVIQKCLHKLSPEHNQFIYDTVSEYCIQVASHKHGCCVYQRCIDHATLSQKAQLVNVITQNALPLVQDPFGNYVVQYVLELGDAIYSDNLIRRFIGPIRELSVQKFSSNVIEKCIRVAERNTKRLLISGIIYHPNMDRFLRDSYANYVIQTCLDFAEEDQRAQFIDCIRPLLPSIRNTPYGKRIYSKIYSNSNRPISNQHQQRMTDMLPITTTTSIIAGMNALSLRKNSSSEQQRNASGSDTPVYT